MRPKAVLTCSEVTEHLRESCPLQQVSVFKPQGATQFCQCRQHSSVGCGTQTLSFPGAQGQSVQHQCSSSAAPVPPALAMSSCASSPWTAGLQGGLEVLLGKRQSATCWPSQIRFFPFKPSSLAQLLIHTGYFCLMGFISQFWYISVHIKTVTCGRCLRKRN